MPTADDALSGTPSSPPSKTPDLLADLMALANPRTTDVHSTYAFFRRLSSLFTWLEKHDLTFERLEDTIRRVCTLHDLGATDDDIVRYVTTAHQIPPEEHALVRELAAFYLHHGTIRRSPGGRYVPTTPQPAETVYALVSVPLSDWPKIAPYTYRDASWTVGPGDGA